LFEGGKTRHYPGLSNVDVHLSPATLMIIGICVDKPGGDTGQI
jgi:hypothetical protein